MLRPHLPHIRIINQSSLYIRLFLFVEHAVILVQAYSARLIPVDSKNGLHVDLMQEMNGRVAETGEESVELIKKWLTDIPVEYTTRAEK